MKLIGTLAVKPEMSEAQRRLDAVGKVPRLRINHELSTPAAVHFDLADDGNYMLTADVQKAIKG